MWFFEYQNDYYKALSEEEKRVVDNAIKGIETPPTPVNLTEQECDFFFPELIYPRIVNELFIILSVAANRNVAGKVRFRLIRAHYPDTYRGRKQDWRIFIRLRYNLNLDQTQWSIFVPLLRTYQTLYRKYVRFTIIR
jgi:hypothetical protein